jgi:hypothetical protein
VIASRIRPEVEASYLEKSGIGFHCSSFVHLILSRVKYTSEGWKELVAVVGLLKRDIGCSSNQDSGKWVVRHKCSTATGCAEWADSFTSEYVIAILANASFHFVLLE